MTEYIKREDAIEMFQRNAYDDWNQGAGTSWAEAFSESAEMIRAIPAADVAPVRHGRWRETTQPMGWDDVTCAECSECGEDFVLDEWGMDDMKNLMLYCPNCGARMDGDGE